MRSGGADAFLLRGEAETRLCDYDTAMRTFQLGCKSDARLGPEARKELRQAWYAAKELCRGWRRAGRLKHPEKKAKAFAAERRPVLHDIAKFEKPEDKALALKVRHQPGPRSRCVLRTLCP